ncbi:RNA-binding S4 domain-containing protein [Methylobrevis pamukkalensis]|uniref:Heat shock protein 15 n=1 Tax=Methylobrevis pamukkalensis TaxID=1439726 RepID=A0A1E3H251_9HYPH|nr:RNA-binding S4 domain-containing protein [Methylobrevis pamukkalensis]ODN69876.1 Heat shock protein 15 [Methylobrevis pamukkalensis]
MRDDRIRVDKWLWFVRAVKSRTLAATLAASGQVRVNRDKIDSPAHALKIGDVLTFPLGSRVRVLKVLALGSRRGPAPEAALLYEDLSPAPPPREAGADEPVATAPVPVRGEGRPTKKARRQYDEGGF